MEPLSIYVLIDNNNNIFVELTNNIGCIRPCCNHEAYCLHKIAITVALLNKLRNDVVAAITLISKYLIEAITLCYITINLSQFLNVLLVRLLLCRIYTTDINRLNGEYANRKLS